MNAFDNNEFEKYKVEVLRKWGNTNEYMEHAEKTKHYSKQKWNNLAEGMDHIMGEFAICMKNGETYDSEKTQELVKILQSHITENYYTCTNEILLGLGKMYVTDERFKKNIDKHEEGTAEYICEAIAVYCSR